MAVRSKSLGPTPQRSTRQRKPAVPPRRPCAPYPSVEPPARSGIGAPAGLMMILFGLPLWALGAKYTLDGVVIGINMLAAFLELPARVPAPTGWWNLLLIPIRLLFSYVESSVRLNLFGGPAQLLTLIMLQRQYHSKRQWRRDGDHRQPDDDPGQCDLQRQCNPKR